MKKNIKLSIFVFLFLCSSFVTASAAVPTVNFEVAQVTIDEIDNSNSVYFLIRRSGDLSEPATVVLSTVDGTASGVSDYEPYQRTVTFAPGVSQREGFTRVIHDGIYEGSEWFSIQLRSTSPRVRIGSQGVLTVLINDAGDYPIVKFTSPTSTFMSVEPTAGRQVVASVAIGLTHPSVEPISITFSATDGTAMAGTDYIASTLTVTFQPLESEPKQMTLTILGDAVNESRETFDMHLLSPVNAEVPFPEQAFTIINKTPYPQQIDFDGNGVADLAGYARWTGTWFLGQYGETSIHMNFPNDVLVPGDYTGDGRTDAAIWRPSNGTWYVVRSEDSSYYAVQFGMEGDVPLPADFDADGIADLAVFRPSTGVWYVQRSSDGSVDLVRFGSEGDRPTPADFDGDSKADVAIYRSDAGGASQWWIRRSSDGAVTATNFGLASDRTIAADYTGDGKSDIAVWRPTTGQWFVLRSEDSSYYIRRLPYLFETPAPGDYSGDGKADYAILNSAGHVWNSWDVNGNGILGLVADPSVNLPLAEFMNVH